MALELKTEISRVTIYPKGATVEVTGNIKLPIGKHEVIFKNINTLGINRDSIRLKGTGSKNIKIHGVELIDETLREFSIEKAKELKSELEKLERELKLKNALVEALNEEEDILQESGQGLAKHFPREYSRGKIAVPEFEMFLIKRRELKEKLNKNRQELEIQIEKLEGDISIIRDKLNRMNTSKRALHAQVTIENDSASETTCELSLSYFTFGASWKAEYDCRVSEDPAVEELDLIYYAIINQRTRGDWNDVQITLSTASPSITTTLPRLEPWSISIYKPPPPSPQNFRAVRKEARLPTAGRRVKGGVKAKTFSVTDSVAVLKEEEIEVVTTNIQEVGDVVVYEVPAKTTIFGDKRPNKVLITLQKLRLKRDYLVVPKHTLDVYSRADVINDSPLVLLPGKMNIFQGNEFIGATTLSKILPNESFELALGKFSGIKVERNLVKKERDKSGMLSKVIRIQLEYLIKIFNLKDLKLPLTVVDHVPHSEDENVKVKILEVTPEPIKKKSLGRLLWKFSLDPINPNDRKKSSQTIKFRFTVEYPADETIIGMNV